MSTSPFTRAKAEHRCDDCLRIIHIDEVYYYRDTDDRTYCSSCAERHSFSFTQKKRDFESDLKDLDRMLLERARTGAELEQRFGTRYVALVRKLNRASLVEQEGGIWIDKKGVGTIYSRERTSPRMRCPRCHRPRYLSYERSENPAAETMACVCQNT